MFPSIQRTRCTTIIYRLVLVVALLFSALQSFPSNRIRTGPLCWASKNEHVVRPPSPRCVLSCPYTCAGAPLPAMLPRPILPPRRCSGVFTTCTSLVLLPIPSFSTAVEETPQLQSSCSTYCCWFDLACLAWLSLSQSVLACLDCFSTEPSTQLTASQSPWPTPRVPFLFLSTASPGPQQPQRHRGIPLSLLPAPHV